MFSFTKDTSVWDKIKKSSLSSKNESLQVGFFEEARYDTDNGNLPVAQIAEWMNTGDPALYPPRPFMSVGFISEIRSADYQKIFKQNITDIAEGRLTLRFAYQTLGPKLVEGLKKVITDWDTPPNSFRTVEIKGFNDPLIHTGKMRDSVEFKVERD